MKSSSIHKRLFWLISLQYLICTAIFAQWAPLQYPGVIGGDFPVINDMDFRSETTGIAVSDNGIIVRTDNGGVDWDTIYTIPESYTFQEIKYFSDARVIAVGHKTVDPGCVPTPFQGIIATSVNNGDTWDTTSVDFNLNAVSFPTAQTGYIAGDCGRLLRSTDAGDNWIELTGTGTVENFEDVDFPSEAVGYLGMTNGQILKTINGASDWDPVNLIFLESTGKIQFFNELEGVTIGFGSGSDFVIIYTTDGGDNWNQFSGGSNELFFMFDHTRGFVGPIGAGLVAYVSESGDSVDFQQALPPAPEAWPLKRVIHFYDETTGYIAGTNTFYVFQPITHTVSGLIFEDENGDCLPQGGEATENKRIVQIEDTGTGAKAYATTDALGNYTLTVGEGNYLLSVVRPNSTWALCEDNVPLNLMDVPTDTIINLGLEIDTLCPVLEVDVATPLLTRCDTNRYFVSYFNRGTDVAENPHINLLFDKDLEVVSSTPDWTDFSGGLYTYNLDDLMPGDSGQIIIDAFLGCTETIEGQTHGVTAKIFPDDICDTLNPIWDQSSVRVDAECIGDSVTFQISNVGAGDIEAALEYIVIEDHILLTRGNFDLGAGLETAFVFYPNGGTLRLEADQSEGHPGRSMPSVAIEGCGINDEGAFSLGFVTQDPEDDLNPFISIENQESIDTNHVNFQDQIFAYPKGYGDGNYILPNTSVEYRIPFESPFFITPNAYRILAIPSEFQDISTIQPGVGSHAYDFSIIGGDTLQFIIADELPQGEKGFVKFRIDQQADNPDGTPLLQQFIIDIPVVDSVISQGSYQHNVSIDSFMTAPNGLIVSGEIHDPEGLPIEMAAVFIDQDNDNPSTGMDGFYTINVPGNYSQDSIHISLNKASLSPEGVSAYDLYLMHEYIENRYTTQWQQVIAADWDRNGLLEQQDILDIQELLGNSVSEPEAFVWRFIPEYPAQDGVPVSSTPAETYTISHPTLNNRANFQGVKLGDFNLSARANNTIPPDTTGLPIMVLEQPNQILQAGESYEIPFTLMQDQGELLSFQWMLYYNHEKLEVLELLPTRFGNNEVLNNLQLNTENPGMLVLTWYQPEVGATDDNLELFKIKVKAKQTVSSRELWTVSSDWLFPEAYLKDDTGTTKAFKVILQNKNENAFQGVLNLTPNPGRGIVFIDYQLDAGQDATIYVVDALGRLVRQYDTSDLSNPEGPVRLDTSTLSSGVYMVYLKTEPEKTEAMKRLIVVD